MTILPLTFHSILFTVSTLIKIQIIQISAYTKYYNRKQESHLVLLKLSISGECYYLLLSYVEQTHNDVHRLLVVVKNKITQPYPIKVQCVYVVNYTFVIDIFSLRGKSMIFSRSNYPNNPTNFLFVSMNKIFLSDI